MVVDFASVDVRYEPWSAPILNGPTRVRQILASDLDTMIAEYVSGMGCVLLPRKYCIAENTVLARLKEAGVPVRPPVSIEPVALAEMASLRADGWTLRARGQRYGLTRQTVAKRLRA